jgi:hypothetical protein
MCAFLLFFLLAREAREAREARTHSMIPIDKKLKPAAHPR